MYFVIHLIFPVNVWPRLICSDGLNGRDVLEENAENNSFEFRFLPWEQHRRCCWTRDRWESSETTHWYIWAWTCKSEIFVKIQQQHSVFSLHVLDNVEDGKEKDESGSPDADVGEDENTGHFYLRNLPRRKHQRIIRCGIHLLPKNITSINNISLVFTWQ